MLLIVCVLKLVLSTDFLFTFSKGCHRTSLLIVITNKKYQVPVRSSSQITEIFFPCCSHDLAGFILEEIHRPGFVHGSEEVIFGL